MPKSPYSIKKVIGNALKMRCPRCGNAPIFVKWGVLVERCESCRLKILAREPDTYFFMYMSAAGITASFIMTTYFMDPPENLFRGRLIVGGLAFCVFLLSISIRKSIAIAIEFYTDSCAEFPRYPD